MRVLLINAFHYLKGGVERTYLDESRWLTAAGHEVAHLATHDPRNLPGGSWDRFAPSTDFSEGAPLGRQLRQLPHAIWSEPARREAEALRTEFRPDIVHVHAPSRYLTPSVMAPFGDHGVPLVMTLHDFKPWCTNRILFAHGAPCERCRGGTHWHAAATACVQGSRAKSVVGSIEAYAHVARHAYAPVRRWIAPSRFVHVKAMSFGVADDALRTLAHGVETVAPDARTHVPAGPYVFFAGRLSLEKGVRLLPAIAMRIAPVPLLVTGEGPLGGWLETQAQGVPNLVWLGYLDDAEVSALRQRAAVVLVPSLFYEHFGYSAAEALMDARPVIASRIGALPELVSHGDTGLLVPPDDAHAIAEAVQRLLGDAGLAARLGDAGAARVREVGDPAKHLAGLLAIYEETIAAA